MNVLSLFSGAGGMDLGLHNAGMTHTAMCEIDPTARQVLARHWPDVPIYDDVTTLDPTEHRERIDLVAGGSPCQDLSVAGRRSGLDGSRSGLFWHQCRIADSVAAPWVLWENVAGAFSSNGGADFAAVLWGLTGTLPDVPDGGWRTAGVVVGPKRTAVWRLLDARWFGVAQRRRRVFVVAGPRGQCRPEVLLESEGVRGNPPPSGTTGEGSAAGAAYRTGRSDLPIATGSLLATMGLRAPGREDMDANFVLPIGFSPKAGIDIQPSRDYWPTLRVGAGEGAAAVAFMPSAVSENHHGGHHEPKVLTPDLAVRRLTPTECERLMGWPDNWTAHRADGTPIADSHRYRMCGNGVVAPVAEWIGRRIVRAVENTEQDTEP